MGSASPLRKPSASVTSSGMATHFHQGAFQAAAYGRHARCRAAQLRSLVLLASASV